MNMFILVSVLCTINQSQGKINCASLASDVYYSKESCESKKLEGQRCIKVKPVVTDNVDFTKGIK